MRASQVEGALREAWEVVVARPAFSSETLNSEWNLAHHYANALARLLPQNLSFDLDVIKPGFNKKRPDIIFHIPGTNANNFLVVEMKRGASERKINQELERVRSNWVSGLGYEFGAVVNTVDGDPSLLEIYLIQRN